MEDTSPSIVEYFGLGSSHRCGYCKNASGNVSTGMWAHGLQCQDYQSLLDRGWRRSGKYVYKPEMQIMCCPLYTIRCDATKVHLSKSQKKVLKKMNKYLLHGKDSSEVSQKDKETVKDSFPPSELQVNHVHPTAAQEDIQDCTMKGSRKGKGLKQLDSKQASATNTAPVVPSGSTSGCVNDASSSDVKRCRKAKEMRREKRSKKLEKLQNEGNDKGVINQKSCPKNVEKSLEDFIEETNRAENLKHRLEVKLVCSCVPDKDFRSSFKEEHALFQKYQISIHNDTADDCDVAQFKRFLVDCPLHLKEGEGDFPGYGAFHYQYRIDGKLIGVGVLDILPNCISSKYFFYDPDYSFLSLGTYSALRELYLVRSLARLKPPFKYYYLGFYIHSCVKMRYKGQYHPSFLLCPETYSWVPIEDCRKLLDKSSYSRLDNKGTGPKEEDVNSVLILHRRCDMSFQLYVNGFVKDERSKKEQAEEVQRYANLVGMPCASRMYLYRK